MRRCWGWAKSTPWWNLKCLECTFLHDLEYGSDSLLPTRESLFVTRRTTGRHEQPANERQIRVVGRVVRGRRKDGPRAVRAARGVESVDWEDLRFSFPERSADFSLTEWRRGDAVATLISQVFAVEYTVILSL